MSCKKQNGIEFIFSLIDNFTNEIKALRENRKFMEFLAQRSRSTQRVSLAEARKRLGI
jgi:hypothetical protein